MLTVGQGDTGQLGLGEDVMEKTRPQVLISRDLSQTCLPAFAWRYLRFSYLLQVVNGIESAVDVAAGGMHTAVLDSNGKVSVTGVGSPLNGIINVSNLLTPTSQLFAKVWTFGCNDEGSLGRHIEEEEDSFLPGEVGHARCPCQIDPHLF